MKNTVPTLCMIVGIILQFSGFYINGFNKPGIPGLLFMFSGFLIGVSVGLSYLKDKITVQKEKASQKRK